MAVDVSGGLGSSMNFSGFENYTELNQTFQGFDYGLLVPLSEDTKSVKAPKEYMSVWAKTAWSTVFAAMVTTATAGNLIVIWIVIAHRRMRTVTNYFLVNLSMADLLLTTLNCMFNFIYMIQRNWPFGDWYCTISNFIANSTVAASVFTLTGISCDRYLAIVHPLEPRMSKRLSLVIISLIWAASMTLALPCLFYSTTITSKYNGVTMTGCILVWPDNKLVGSVYDLWYQMIFLLITYVIPMALMTISYTIMGKELWGSKAIGEKTQRQLDAIRSKKKIVKMFILVVLIFGLCWLPYHGYFIYIYFDTSVIYHPYTQHVYLGFYWFAMSNAMVNPVIYYWMNARFRQYYRSAICGWKTCTDCTYERSDSYSLRNTPSNSKSGEFRDRNGTMRSRHSSRRERRCENGDAVHHSVLSPISKDYCEGKVQLNDHICNTNKRWSNRSWRKRPITTDL